MSLQWLIHKIKSRTHHNTLDIVLDVISFFEKQINCITDVTDPSEFFANFKALGKQIENADTMSFYVGNIVNWMISIVWKEAKQLGIEIEKEGVKEIT